MNGAFAHDTITDTSGSDTLDFAGATAELRFTIGSGNSVRVSFEIADFDVLMNWLDGLARDYGVAVTDFSADKVEGQLDDARLHRVEAQHAFVGLHVAGDGEAGFLAGEPGAVQGMQGEQRQRHQHDNEQQGACFCDFHGL